MWTTEDIVFDLDPGATDAGIATVVVTTPAGRLTIMAEVVRFDRVVLVRGVHVQGLRPNALGQAKLRVIARAFLETFDVEELVIQGGIRSTGARPGHVPLAFRYRRRPT